MATFHAIQATCEAVRQLLAGAFRPDLLEPPIELQFEIYSTDDFRAAMPAGVSLFLYRVHINAVQRRPLERRDDGTFGRPQLPLDLHFFLTVWGRRASLQHAILGWAMRTLEDQPILPASLLDSAYPHARVFQDDETIEVVPGQLSNEELMRIWDDLGTDYRLSVPYIARVVRIDSKRQLVEPQRVRRRDFQYATAEL